MAPRNEAPLNQGNASIVFSWVCFSRHFPPRERYANGTCVCILLHARWPQEAMYPHQEVHWCSMAGFRFLRSKQRATTVVAFMNSSKRGHSAEACLWLCHSRRTTTRVQTADVVLEVDLRSIASTHKPRQIPLADLSAAERIETSAPDFFTRACGT